MVIITMIDLKELNQLNASFASLKPAMLTDSPCGFPLAT